MEVSTGRINTYRKVLDSAPGRGNSHGSGMLEEWQKLLLRSVIINVSGHIISGVLTHVQFDHIIVVDESHVHIIPSRSVAFISYRIKSEK